jgi:hypothetical protein
MNSSPAPGSGPSPALLVVFVDPAQPPLPALVGALQLTANGAEIMNGVDGNRVFAGDHYIAYQLADLEPGDWVLDITGASGLPKPVDFELHASVHRPGTANTEEITIVCELIQGASVRGAGNEGGCGGSAQTSGALLLPEVGDEVLVGYLPGDPTGSPDRPLVLGRIYSPAIGATHMLELEPNDGPEEFTGLSSGFFSGLPGHLTRQSCRLSGQSAATPPGRQL